MARKTQTMKKNKRKISLFNERNFALVDYTDMNLFCAANFGESYYNDSKVEKESLFGQRNFAQSYYVNEQNKKQHRNMSTRTRKEKMF